MAETTLEDEVVLNLIPKSEQERLRKFNEQYSQFRKSWDDYLKKIKAYRESK